MPVGKSALITLSRKRADTELDVTSEAKFTFGLNAGKHGRGWNHGWRGHRAHRDYQRWATWQDFCDAVQGLAPDNIDLAGSFKRHRAPHYYLDVLDELAGRVRYKVRFEGKIIRAYKVQGFNADGSPYHLVDAEGR